MNKLLIIKADIERLEADLKQALEQLDLVSRTTELKDYEKATATSDFWQKDRIKAQSIQRRKAKLENLIQPWLNLQIDFSDLVELVKSCDQQAPEKSFLSELQVMLDNLKTEFENLKEQLKFSGPYDDHEVILSIFAGAGGTDAQDWVQMLLRMYTRWAERQKIKIELISQSSGEEAGLKSVSLHLRAKPFIYGRLKGEHGVHRLVRLSPFNAQNLRQTSFAKVEIMPALDQSSEIDLKDTELRIDTYRSGGHGGQSVNTTDSAVRVTHLPTKLTVSIQNERSQSQNKELALMVMRSKLAQLKLRENVRAVGELKGKNIANEWGSQIRNYVLHPYKQVKDLRSQYTTSDVDGILDGHLEELLKSHLSVSNLDKR